MPFRFNFDPEYTYSMNGYNPYYSDSGEVFKRKFVNDPRDFIKKSINDNKAIRFHQCYFNPISCFRRR